MQVEDRLFGEDGREARRRTRTCAAPPGRSPRARSSPPTRAARPRRRLQCPDVRPRLTHRAGRPPPRRRGSSSRSRRASGRRRLAPRPRLPERHDVVALRHLAAQHPVVELGNRHDDGIRVADRHREALRVGPGVAGIATFTPRRVDVVRLGRIVVEPRRADPAAVQHPHREREAELPAAPSAVHYRPTCVISWSRQGYEASYCISQTGLNPAMHSPTAPPGSRPRRAACRAFDRVEEAVAQPDSRPEDAAGAADVLAHHHHVGVALEEPTWKQSLMASRTVRLSKARQDPSQLRRGRARTTPAGRQACARTTAPDRPAAPPRRR